MSKANNLLKDYDFSGWATRNNLRCSDGRTIMEDAFKHNDGQVVPLVWMHSYDDPSKVLGHALLKNEKEGVRAYGKFNDTEAGINARKLVHSGDVKSLSIYANHLQQKAINNGVAVIHGDIKEVSLVLAGANPGAYIDSEIVHGEYSDEAAFISTGDTLSLSHADNKDNKDNKEDDTTGNEDETVEDIFNTLTDKQKKAVYAIVGVALEDKEGDELDDNDDSKGGNNSMKHNAFEGENVQRGNVLSHADMEAIFSDAKRGGSLRTAYEDYINTKNLAHAEDGSEDPAADAHVAATYGIDYLDYLFPEHKTLNGGAPEFIKRDTGWVAKVMSGVHHTPFAKIKSVFADIREDEARAKGYIKGNRKKEEVFSLLKRKTGPTTVYKKQKFDRDDIIDITDFDAVAWVKAEMRMMLEEEFARAYLFGDGRLASSDDKIDEQCIRPAISDDQLYTIQVIVNGTTDAEKAGDLVDKVVIGQDTYQGSGNITAFIKQSWVTKMLLLKDEVGHRLYKNITELATAMSVDSIVKVPDSIIPKNYYGVALDLNDYNVGADKGGAVSLFDDFDINYNQLLYLIESRCSGALTKPFSAIAIKEAA